MRRLILASALLAACIAGPAAAYTLKTVTSKSCHERITVEALGPLLAIIGDIPDIEVPDDDTLRRLLKSVQFPGTADLDLGTRFFLLSVITGVRSPDTEGHSTLNLSVLRRVHADPDPRGQYAHALRAIEDDGVAGDLSAIEGTRDAIREELMSAGAAFQARTVTEKPFYVDHYGTLDIPVALTAWHLGRAIHALQDAHAHMVWDGDVEYVVHVLNYVEAVEGTLREGRDGLAHSGALDDCNNAKMTAVVDRARGRTTALTEAMGRFLLEGDGSLFDRGIAPCDDMATDRNKCGWLRYNPPCEAALRADDANAIQATCCDGKNDFCGSPFAEVARQEPAGPYLGCAAAPFDGGGGAPLAWATVLLLLAVSRGRRRGVAAVVLAMGLCVPTARADDAPRAFITVEGHGSALDDTANAALLAPTFGAGVRGGWRWGRWRAGLHVERNWWVPVEFGVSVDPGVLNVAAFGEVLWFDGFVRSSFGVGAAILMYDTDLDGAGTTGPFIELRPAGLRWAVGGGVHLVFDPLSVAVVHPVLRDPPLRKIERRTLFGVEATFL